MKTISKYIMCLFAILAFASCEKDETKLYLSPLEDTDLVATTNRVILSADLARQQVLSFAWTGQSLTVNDPNYSAPNVLTATMLVSSNEDMRNAIESNETSNSKSYSGQELNTLANNLGLEPSVATPVYFCLKYSVSPNTAPVYSNVVEVAVSPYFIDMRYASLLDSDKNEINKTFFSENKDGIYSGFMGAGAWYGYFLKEGDGTVWGNIGESGKEFFLSSSETPDARWNMWYPGLTGCYYSIVNTKAEVWSAMYIPSLTLSGDIEAEMTYDRPNNRWIYVFDAKEGSINITISGTGNQYDTNVGVDDEAAALNSSTVGFSGDSQNLIFGKDASSVSLNITGSGESTLILDLNNADAFKIYVESGATEEETVNEKLWITGQDDGITNADWNFDSYLRLYNEDNKSYNGVVNINSLWGYQFFAQPEWGATIYGVEEGTGTPESGELVEGGKNIPQPEPGVYLMNASLSAMSYQTMLITDVTVEGLNDNWTVNYPMSATSIPGVYEVTVDITNNCGWGFKFLINWDWNHVYGGYDGITYYNGSDIKYDDSLIGGTYTITLDLINGTYTIQ